MILITVCVWEGVEGREGGRGEGGRKDARTPAQYINDP